MLSIRLGHQPLSVGSRSATASPRLIEERLHFDADRALRLASTRGGLRRLDSSSQVYAEEQLKHWCCMRVLYLLTYFRNSGVEHLMISRVSVSHPDGIAFMPGAQAAQSGQHSCQAEQTANAATFAGRGRVAFVCAF